MKGQLGMLNLVAIFVALVLYLFLFPVLNSIIQAQAIAMQSTPNQYLDLEIALMYLMPFVILIGIAISIIRIANPQQPRY